MPAFQLKLHMVAIATIFSLSVAFSIPLETEDANINQLRLIGTIEGKTFFAEPTITLTWPEAKIFCATSGMRLAHVTSVAQAALLKNAHSSVFSTCHWTGGRDAVKPSQFVWDSTDVVLSSSVVAPFVSEDGMQTCVCFRPSDKTFFSKVCRYKFKALCELNHGKTLA